jgi:multiple sugar transport system permease protein
VIGALLLLTWSIGPTLWIVIASVQPEGAVTSVPLALEPSINLTNYVALATDPTWIESIWVSLQVAIGTAALTLAVGALAAYPLARLELPGKPAFMGVLILTQMVPAIVLAIPVLLLFDRAGLKDTTIGLILANVAFSVPLAVWLLRNVFEDVPRALESAARIDGCSRLGTIFRITMPAAAPGIAAVAILLLIGTWNEFLFAVILGNEETVTVTRRIGFIDAIGPSGVPPYTVQAAAGVLAILPCLVLVFLFHRRIVAGLTEGYVKG